jgi:hypothetical protein
LALKNGHGVWQGARAWKGTPRAQPVPRARDRAGPLGELVTLGKEEILSKDCFADCQIAKSFFAEYFLLTLGKEIFQNIF